MAGKNKTWLSAFLFILLGVHALGANTPCLIRFIDKQNGLPVPMVELHTMNGLVLQSDNLGHVAIIEPDLEGKSLRMLVKGHGYRVPGLDFFGERSVTMQLIPGKVYTVKLERTTPAERLYRITGSGRYRDSLLAGIKLPAPELYDLPGLVVGLDSAVPVKWQNRLLIFYGDTIGPANLNLSGSGAEVDLTAPGTPATGLRLNFFTEKDGFARKMFPRAEPGFVWVETVIPLKLSHNGSKEVLAARYIVHETLERAVEEGFAIFSESQKQFKTVKRFATTRHHKSAHAFPTIENDREFWHLQPWERVENLFSQFINPENHEFYSCLRPARPSEENHATLVNGSWMIVERDQNNRPVFAWRKNGAPFTAEIQKSLIASGALNPDERWLQLTEITSGQKHDQFSGSISFNTFLNRWIMIAQGHTGEIWYSEADTCTGPWVYAKKIVEHDGYNFYNPVHHRWFDQNQGKEIFFEGTFTSFFTASERKTPRSDYNQVMYRLNLDNSHMRMPVAVYRVRDEKANTVLLTGRQVTSKNSWEKVMNLEFFAFEEKDDRDWLKLHKTADGDGFFVICDPAKAEEAGFAPDLLMALSQIGSVLKPQSTLLTLTPQITGSVD